MIKLARGDTPSFFTSPLVQELRGEAAAFFSRLPASRAQMKFDFQRLATRMYPTVRRILRERFPAKCAYCETPLERFEIEAFRPKQRATNLDGKADDDHYWWLAFEWSNYFPACSICNALKGPRFPVAGSRAPIGALGAELASENRLLLDPCEDEPTQVLLFLDDGRVTCEEERGRVTIDVLGLNREALVQARQQDLRTLLALLGDGKPAEKVMSKVVDTLTAMTTDASPFAAMRRQYVRAWAIEASQASDRLERLTRHLREHHTALAAGLGARHKALNKASTGLSERVRAAEAYSVESVHVSASFYRQARFIERIELKNIRAFEQLELRPPIGASDRGEWFVLLGENGSGKSSVLQAVTCALLGQEGVNRLGVRATDLLRRGCAKGEVRVHVTGMSTPVVMTLWRRGNRITVEPRDPKLMVLAYGATRLLNESSGTQKSARVKVSNLFDPYARLSNGRPWLYKAGKAEFDRFARSLSALLPRSDGARFTRRAGQIYVETPGVRDTLANLSSGYQAVLALALDIMSVMRTNWEDMESAEGIVLIDEVDAHLHPRWKMRIVRRLREVFPRMQFIATSHEPLTLRGLERSEVAVLKRSLDGSVSAITADSEDFPSPKFMRVDQLLTSELFGLHSTEDVEIDALFEEYYALLAARTRSPKKEERLKQLRVQLEAGKQMGLTPREKLAFEAADAFIADRKATQKTLPHNVRLAARERLKQIWAGVEGEAAPAAAPAAALVPGGETGEGA
jgi:uncharacterized protein (TIGR02646 family)